jgi:hypothetical protein
MTEIARHKAKDIRPARLIGQLQGKTKGPTLFFFGGIHGNEMAGVRAIEKVFKVLGPHADQVKGSIFGIRGNIPAQLSQKRFLDDDLNRLWTTDRVAAIVGKPATERNVEESELFEINALLTEVLRSESPPFYFIDFHTTSGKTRPFITINDALINRRFSLLFPVPIVLGIEEYLEGPLLSLMNEQGYVSLGFESGQHSELNAVSNAYSFMWLGLVYAGSIPKTLAPDFETLYGRLQKDAKGDSGFYEVTYRHLLAEGTDFKMLPGFMNFQNVGKDTTLALQDGEEIKTKKSTTLFMPLYQKQGKEGYFLIRRIPKWALRASTVARNLKIDGWLIVLPGISWSDDKKEQLLVNSSIARFFTKSFFHVLGYRSRILGKSKMLMQNRERTAKNAHYKNEWWFKNDKKA